MNVLVILTGGTIGSLAKDSVISVDAASPYLLLKLYEKNYGSEIAFDVIQPFHTLSENMLPSDWNCLFDTLKNVSFKDYDGIVITHGSDTLAYTSSLFSMLFSGIPIPIVFIAANYNLEDSRSNGLINFKSALDFIQEANRLNYFGVFTVYQNDKKENLVYLPTRLLPSDPYEDQFSCFGGIPFGKIQQDGFHKYPDACLPLSFPDSPVFETLKLERLNADILKIVPYPGFSYDHISLENKPDAILHQLYHSGTCCTADGQPAYSFEAFAKRCAQKAIPLYVCSIKHPDGAHYESTHKLLAAKVRPLYNISYVSAYTKLILAYSQTVYDPQELMNLNLYNEILPEPKL